MLAAIWNTLLRQTPKAEALPGRAIELRRGGVYVIESEQELNAESVADISAYLARFGARTGCEFLLLDAGLHIAVAGPEEGGV